MAALRPTLPCAFPALPDIRGSLVDLERADPAIHGEDLWEAIGARAELWSEIPPGPFADQPAFMAWLEARAGRADAVLYAVIDTSAGRHAVGLFFLLNIDGTMGVLELGLVYGPDLSRRRQGTEAFYQIVRSIFDTFHYRRLEWRCNPGNAASLRAASRYGFQFEGVMRQSMWVKDRNWDTALHAMTDGDWPEVRTRLEAWLAPANFTPDGRQIRSLDRSGAPA